MTDYDAEDFELRAIAGDWRAAVSVLSRSTLKPEVLSALMTDDAHDEIRIALAMRQDVTPEQLAWVAGSDNTFILNRLVSHPRTPMSTLRDIRDRSEGRSEEVWAMLHVYAKRIVERREQEAGGLHKGRTDCAPIKGRTQN